MKADVMRFAPSFALLGVCAVVAACSATPKPNYAGSYKEQAQTRASFWGSISPWSHDLADGTRPYACTAPRMAEIARFNTQALLKMAQGEPEAALPTLMGPQRRDQLSMPDGRTLEVWYFRSYVDSVNTSMGYDVGLTPVVVDGARKVVAVGPATANVRGDALSTHTLAYGNPCQTEESPLAVTWNNTR